MISVRILLLVLSAVVSAQRVTSLRRKRILLNDPDVFNAKLLDLEKRINELETENSNLKQLNVGQKIQTLETENRNLGQRIQTLESKTSDHGQRIHQLETQNSNLTQSNLNLGQRIHTIEFENTNIKQLNIGQRIQTLETENSNLKQLNQNLEQKIKALETESNKSKQQNLGPRVNGLETENSRLKQLVNTVSTSQSATFIRWGRKDCPSLNGTSLVYSGIAGGGAHIEKGGGENMLCLPHDPDSLSVVPSRLQLPGMYARIYGTEYQFSYKNAVLDDDVPCAVCQVTTATSALMIPAKSSCPSGLLKQYDGLLVGDYYGYSTSEFVCLDNDPQYFEGKRGSTDGNLFYPAVGVCGTLPCPSYVNDKYLPCVLCTKS